MPAGTMDLTGEFRVEQGATHVFTVTIANEDGTVYDLSGATATAELAQTKGSATTYAWSCSINTTTGVITCTMSSAISDTVTFTSGYWQLDVTESSGKVIRLLEGTAEIDLKV